MIDWGRGIAVEVADAGCAAAVDIAEDNSSENKALERDRWGCWAKGVAA